MHSVPVHDVCSTWFMKIAYCIGSALSIKGYCLIIFIFICLLNNIIIGWSCYLILFFSEDRDIFNLLNELLNLEDALGDHLFTFSFIMS